MQDEVLRLNKIIKEKDIIIEQLKSDLNKKEKDIIKRGEDLTKLEIEMKNMEIEIKRLKIDLKVKIEENKDNKRIKVKFQSSDSVINDEIESFENDKFIVIEEKLYIKFENYKETNNIFLVKGNQVLRYKTLKENKIGDGQVVVMNIFD